MREKIIRLMTLSNLVVLFLAIITGIYSLEATGKHHDSDTSQTLLPSSTSVAPSGNPGSGKGQGPVLVSTFKPFESGIITY